MLPRLCVITAHSATGGPTAGHKLTTTCATRAQPFPSKLRMELNTQPAAFYNLSRHGACGYSVRLVSIVQLEETRTVPVLFRYVWGLEQES